MCRAGYLVYVRGIHDEPFRFFCHGIDHHREHNGDASGHLLGPGCHGTQQGDDVYLETNQFACKFGKSLILPFRESRLELDIVAFDVAGSASPCRNTSKEGLNGPKVRETQPAGSSRHEPRSPRLYSSA
jgi:hypothetical protein